MALKTAHDPLARMALCRGCWKRRGLDVTPDIQRKLRVSVMRSGAAILDIILRRRNRPCCGGGSMVPHLCEQRGLQAEAPFATCSASRPCAAAPPHSTKRHIWRRVFRAGNRSAISLKTRI